MHVKIVDIRNWFGKLAAKHIFNASFLAWSHASLLAEAEVQLTSSHGNAAWSMKPGLWGPLGGQRELLHVAQGFLLAAQESDVCEINSMYLQVRSVRWVHFPSFKVTKVSLHLGARMLTFLHLGWLFCWQVQQFQTRPVPLQCSLWITIQGISAFCRTVWMATAFSERQQLATKCYTCQVLSAMYCSIEHTCHFTHLNRPRPSLVQSAMQSFWDVSRTQQGLLLGSFCYLSWIILSSMILPGFQQVSQVVLKTWIMVESFGVVIFGEMSAHFMMNCIHAKIANSTIEEWF